MGVAILVLIVLLICLPFLGPILMGIFITVLVLIGLYCLIELYERKKRIKEIQETNHVDKKEAKFIYKKEQQKKQELELKLNNKKESLIKENYEKLKLNYQKLRDKYFKDSYTEEKSLGGIATIFDNHIYILMDIISYDDYKNIYSDELKNIHDFSELDKINFDTIKLKEIKYSLDDVKYYMLTGNKENQMHITGGGGGGSSIKGAVVGSIIAGGPGAIIGSRKKINNIETTYEEVDTRKTIICFKDKQDKVFSYLFYEILLDYIPEKEYDNYIQSKKSKGKN